MTHSIADLFAYLIFVQNHLDELLVDVSQVEGGVEGDSSGFLLLEVDVWRTLIQADADRFLKQSFRGTFTMEHFNVFLGHLKIV